MGAEFGGEWVHVCVWLSPFTVHGKLSQHCSSAILQDRKPPKPVAGMWVVCFEGRWTGSRVWVLGTFGWLADQVEFPVPRMARSAFPHPVSG